LSRKKKRGARRGNESRCVQEEDDTEHRGHQELKQHATFTNIRGCGGKSSDSHRKKTALKYEKETISDGVGGLNWNSPDRITRKLNIMRNFKKARGKNKTRNILKGGTWSKRCKQQTVYTVHQLNKAARKTYINF